MTQAAAGRTPDWHKMCVLDLTTLRFLHHVLAVDDEAGLAVEYLHGPDGSVFQDSNGRAMTLRVRRPCIAVLRCPDGWPARQDGLPQPRRRDDE